ncbi:MAG: DUF642 domain-containing protein, partial [Acidimicrobiales bacterium]
TTSTTTERETATTTEKPRPAASLVNGGFDSLPVPSGSYLTVESSQVAGWTSSSGVFEVWHRDKNGVGSADGSNLIELNADGATTIVQDFATTPGSTLRWTFHHRGREGKDAMQFLLGPSDGSLESIKKVRTGRNWKRYSGSYEVPKGQTSTRIAFTSLESGSVGNLLDGVAVSVES